MHVICQTSRDSEFIGRLASLGLLLGQCCLLFKPLFGSQHVLHPLATMVLLFSADRSLCMGLAEFVGLLYLVFWLHPSPYAQPFSC